MLVTETRKDTFCVRVQGWITIDDCVNRIAFLRRNSKCPWKMRARRPCKNNNLKTSKIAIVDIIQLSTFTVTKYIVYIYKRTNVVFTVPVYWRLNNFTIFLPFFFFYSSGLLKILLRTSQRPPFCPVSAGSRRKGTKLYSDVPLSRRNFRERFHDIFRSRNVFAINSRLQTHKHFYLFFFLFFFQS